MISNQSASAHRGDHTIAMTMTKQTCWLAALALPLVVGPVWCLVWSSQNHWLGTLAGLVLLAVLAACTVTDVRSHRIFNWATYSAFLWAILINIAASAWPSTPPAWLGGVGIGQSLGGAALCFLITLAGITCRAAARATSSWRPSSGPCWECSTAFSPSPIAISLPPWR